MDFIIYMNEYVRIIENVKLTKVKTYSYKLPKCLIADNELNDLPHRVMLFPHENVNNDNFIHIKM